MGTVISSLICCYLIWELSATKFQCSSYLNCLAYLNGKEGKKNSNKKANSNASKERIFLKDMHILEQKLKHKGYWGEGQDTHRHTWELKHVPCLLRLI